MFNEWKSRVANWSRLKVCLQEEKEKNAVYNNCCSLSFNVRTNGDNWCVNQNWKNIEIQLRIKCIELIRMYTRFMENKFGLRCDT